MKRSIHMAAVVIWASAALLPVDSLAADNEPWQFGASIYGWFPDISGQTSFSQSTGGGDFEIGIDSILENLNFVLMGTFDARKGRWGVVTDMLYMDVGDSQSGVREASIGRVQLPVTANGNVEIGMQSWIVTLAGYYRTVDRPEIKLDLLGGVRYLDVEQDVTWNITGNVGSIPVPDRAGTATAELQNWDAIVGAKGRLIIGANSPWFVPYYLDIGTGDSDLTWQGIAGVGYAFHWGETVAAWRYLSYDLPSGSAIADINFSGPVIGATFRW